MYEPGKYLSLEPVQDRYELPSVVGGREYLNRSLHNVNEESECRRTANRGDAADLEQVLSAFARLVPSYMLNFLPTTP